MSVKKYPIFTFFKLLELGKSGSRNVKTDQSGQAARLQILRRAD